ncbi:MAG TPA: M48 family metallopeptidase [Methanocella sp.]|nr:M48 family metallopeptidase [Methanocella sp.]
MGVDDYYVKGEARQGILFYLFLALVCLVIVIAGLLAYDYVRATPVREIVWSAVYFLLVLATGAVVGIFTYDWLGRFRFLQLLVRNSLKVSPHSFPEVFDAVKLAAGRLSMAAPYTFVTQNPAVNAYTIRVGLLRKKKVIAINAGLLHAMEGDELLFIIGHELAHIKYGRWRRLKGTGLPYLASPQFSEFRCDRGGLMACRNIDASARALLKLVTGRELIDRVDIRSVERDKTEEMPGVLRRLATHPMIDARIKELRRFHGSPEYKKETGGR